MAKTKFDPSGVKAAYAIVGEATGTTNAGDVNIHGQFKIDGTPIGDGSGNVVGPASATNNHLAVFDGTTGELIKDGGAPNLGDVVGPASAVDNNLVVFNGTTGKLIKDGGSPKTITVNPQVGTTYTLLAADNGKFITLNNASAITLTVPAGLGAGFNCVIEQLGAGAVTPTASGTTINSNGGLTVTNGQYAVCSLIASAANVFVFSGDRA